MTYTPNRETLELAALACGLDIRAINNTTIFVEDENHKLQRWQPHLPTMQGKADLLGLIDAIPMDVKWFGTYVDVEFYQFQWFRAKAVIGDNKHAALAEAALKVAAQIGAKMKGGV